MSRVISVTRFMEHILKLYPKTVSIRAYFKNNQSLDINTLKSTVYGPDLKHIEHEIILSAIPSFRYISLNTMGTAQMGRNNVLLIHATRTYIECLVQKNRVAAVWFFRLLLPAAISISAALPNIQTDESF